MSLFLLIEIDNFLFGDYTIIREIEVNGMNTYKIGNKSQCIIRSYNSENIGDVEIQYNNQPYTILKNIEATLNFNTHNRDISVAHQNKIAFNNDFVSEINLSNIVITDKILNLIYSKNEDKLCSVAENYITDEEKHIFLNTSAEEIYQVFIYKKNGILEAAYGTLDVSEGLYLEEANESYLICYSYLGNKSVNLNKTNNYYLTLDLEIPGNINDNTSTMWIHIDKCILDAEKNMYFRNLSNTIDLTFKVINDDTTNHYITLG